MGVISDTQFIAISDRLARQAIELENAVLFSQSGTSYYVNVHGSLPATGDYQIEADLITPANTADNGFTMAKVSSTFFAGMINALNTHVTSRGGTQIATMDDYIIGSGLRVHELFGVAFEDVTGGALKAKSVFRDDEIEMAVQTFSGSGTGTFTDGDRLGAGAGGDFVRDDYNAGTTPDSANQKVAYYIASGTGGGIPADIQISVIGTNSDGNTFSVNATITSGTTIGTKTEIGTTNERFSDITTMQIAGGTSGDVLTIRSLVERGVGL